MALLKQAGVLESIPERVAVIITVGGSTQNWMTLTLPALQMSMFMQSIKVVDQMMATRCARPGQVLLYPEFLEKARTLGKHLVVAMNTPYDKVKWLGEEGWCPVCRSNLVMHGKPHWDGTSYAIECAMCGAGGTLEIEDGRPRFVVAEEGLNHCRILKEGRNPHSQDLTNISVCARIPPGKFVLPGGGNEAVAVSKDIADVARISCDTVRRAIGRFPLSRCRAGAHKPQEVMHASRMER